MVLAKRKVIDLKVTELKVELEKRCADTKGLKGVLQKRLLNILEEEGITTGELMVDTVATPGKKSKLSLRENAQDSPSSKASLLTTSRRKSSRGQLSSDMDVEASGDVDFAKDDEKKTDDSEGAGEQTDDNKKDSEEVTPSSSQLDEDDHNIFSRFSAITQDSEDESALSTSNDTEAAAAGASSAELEDNSNEKQDEKMEDDQDSSATAVATADDQSEQATEKQEEQTTGEHEERTDDGESEQQQEGEKPEKEGEEDDETASNSPEEQEETSASDVKPDEEETSTKDDTKTQEDANTSAKEDTPAQEQDDGAGTTANEDDADEMDTIDDIEASANDDVTEEDVKSSQEMKANDDSITTSQNDESISEAAENEQDSADLNKHKIDTSDVVEIGNEFLDTLDYDLDTADCVVPKDGGAKLAGKDDEETTSATDNLKISSSPNKEGDERSKSDSSDKSDIKNLWVTGLSSTTKASKLKAAFSEHGKVVGAKIVTNSRSPGSECFGFVAMASVEAADLCVKNLHNTDLDGMKISVEKRRNLPGKRNGKDSYIDRSSSTRSTERKSSQTPSSSDKKADSTIRDRDSRTRLSSGPVDRDHRRLGSDRHSERYRERNTLGQDRDRRRRSKSGDRGRSGYRSNTDMRRSTSGDPRKRPRLMDQIVPGPTAPRKVVIDNNGGGGVSLRVNVSSRHDLRDNRSQRDNHHPPPTTSRTMAAHRRSPPPRQHHAPAPSRYTSRSGDSDRRGDYHRRNSPPPPPRRGMSPPRGRDGIRGRGDPLPPRSSGGPSFHMPQASYHRDMERIDTAELARVRREEREKVEREKRLIEKERQEQKRLEMERIKIENEKKKMVANLARERDELHNLKNSLDNSHREHLKRPYYDAAGDLDSIRSKRSTYDDNNSRHHPQPRFSYDSRDRGRGGGTDHSYRPPVGSADPNHRGGDSRGADEARPRGSVSSAPTGASARSSYEMDQRNRRSGGGSDMYQSPSSSSDNRYRSSLNTSKMDSYPMGGDERRITSGQARDSRPRHHDIDAHDERKVVSRDNRARSTAQPSRSPVYRRNEGNIMTSSTRNSDNWHPYHHASDACRPSSGDKMRLSGGVASGSRDNPPSRDDLREEIRRPAMSFNDFLSRRDDDVIRRRTSPPPTSSMSRVNMSGGGGSGGRGMGGGKPIPTQTGGGGRGNGGGMSSAGWNTWNSHPDSGVKSSYAPSSSVSNSQGLSRIGSLVSSGGYGAGGVSNNQQPPMNVSNNGGGGGGMSNRMPNPLLHVDPNHRYNSAQYKPMHRY